MARLIYQVFEGENFTGKNRWLCDNYPDFRNIEFHDTIDSIIVYKGPDYKAGDVARFYDSIDFTNGYIELSIGKHPQLGRAPFRFGNAIASVKVYNPADVNFDKEPHYIIHLYDIANSKESANFKGRERIFFDSIKDLKAIDFSDKAYSVWIDKTSKWTGEKVVNFFDAEGFTGGVMAEKLNLGKVGTVFPIKIEDLSKYEFHKKISSVLVGYPIRLDKFGKVEMLPAGVKMKEEEVEIA